jgi:hypothetical protein
VRWRMDDLFSATAVPFRSECGTRGLLRQARTANISRAPGVRVPRPGE